jgi:squalene synthase HpnC
MTDTHDPSQPETVQSASGKNSKNENFPVGSFLLSKVVRPHVAVFYAFARAIDDVADNPEIAPQEKIDTLDGFDKALMGLNDDPMFEKAHTVRSSLIYTGVPIQHCRDLISAFKQDAFKSRYDNWDDLIDYCDRSAAPVGRYLLDLHGVSKNLYPASDALCNALQVINHLQDCQEDYREMDRVYLPQDWMVHAKIGVDALNKPFTGRGLRQVMDICLNETAELLNIARELPGPMSSRRLAMESAAIIRIAEQLVDELRLRDPLAERVALTKPQYMLCCAQGVLRLFFGR